MKSTNEYILARKYLCCVQEKGIRLHGYFCAEIPKACRHKKTLISMTDKTDEKNLFFKDIHLP